MKLSIEKNLLMCQRIKELEDMSFNDITIIINSEFNTDFDRSSIKYWYYKVFHYKWISKLKTQEQIMNRWKDEINTNKTIPKEELLAEKLFDLFNENISSSEFDSKLLSN